jgi:hypothetical protein
VLWKLVDVVVILVAFGALLLLGPGVIGFSKWKNRLFRRAPDENSG